MILQWENINLFHDCEGHLPCDEPGCQIVAKHVLRAPGGPHYSCGRHKKRCEKKWNGKVADYFPALDPVGGQCMGVKRDGSLCSTSARWESPVGPLCTVHRKSAMAKMEKDCQLREIKRRPFDKIPLAEICHRMFKELDKLLPAFSRLGVTEFYIENQPVMKNANMKSVAVAIYSWAITRGQIDHPEGWSLDTVKFVNACNKTKIASAEAQQAIKDAVDEKVYDVTKNTSIDYARLVLADDPVWSECLEAFQKKDDPCDAFMQGLYVLDRDH